MKRFAVLIAFICISVGTISAQYSAKNENQFPSLLDVGRHFLPLLAARNNNWKIELRSRRKRHKRTAHNNNHSVNGKTPLNYMRALIFSNRLQQYTPKTRS